MFQKLAVTPTNREMNHPKACKQSFTQTRGAKKNQQQMGSRLDHQDTRNLEMKTELTKSQNKTKQKTNNKKKTRPRNNPQIVFSQGFGEEPERQLNRAASHGYGAAP
jgi:hypothetical protein